MMVFKTVFWKKQMFHAKLKIHMDKLQANLDSLLGNTGIAAHTQSVNV